MERSREELIALLARDVLLSDDPPYEELETSLGELIDLIRGGERPPLHADWPAIVSEATNLRPRGH